MLRAGGIAYCEERLLGGKVQDIVRHLATGLWRGNAVDEALGAVD